MTRQKQMIVLGVLFVVLLGVLYQYKGAILGETAGSTGKVTIDQRFTPLDVDNPALRMDILKRFLELEYKGVHRSIFSATLPPPPAPPASSKPVVVAEPPRPTGPPPLTVDAKYFGYVSDTGGSHRKAFFATSNNEDVFIAGEGDTLLGRFRVDHITSTTADVEEVSSGRHATLTMEQPGPNG
jgi:hypothetical protein